MCEDARVLIKDEWSEGKISEELTSRLLRQLQGDPVPALCEYLRAFEVGKKKLVTLRKSNN